MKKNGVLLFCFCLIATFMSCNKESIQERSKESVQLFGFSCSYGDIGFLSLEEGRFHNELLSILIQEWSECDFSASSVNAEIKRILSADAEEVVEDHDMDYGAFVSFLDSINLSSLTALSAGSINFYTQVDSMNLSNTISDALKDGIEMIEGISPTATVSEVQDSLCNFYYSKIGALDSVGILYLGSFIDVASHSVEFWLPTSLGGDNKFSEFRGNLNTLCRENVEERAPFWARIVLSDAIGVVATAAITLSTPGGAATLVPNPAFGGVPSIAVIGLIGGVSASLIGAL